MRMFIFVGVSRFLVCVSILLLCLLYSGGVKCFWLCTNNVYSNIFVFDSISFYLILLIIFLGIYSQVIFCSVLGSCTRFFLFMRLAFTILCFCIKHSVLFWCFYELSIISLLYLIFSESPYSERFIAGWYFSAYLLSTSLPLILILLYLSFIKGSLFFRDWVNGGNSMFIVYLLLSFVFFTKVPLIPFHTWLPIVHAEATSIVSIFLRGYIMKLGLLGVYRCSYYIFDFRFLTYLFLCCVVSVFFLITSCNELDGKRWLAFLSLSHIVVPFLGFFVGSWISIKFSFFYCLGHGLSAGIVFGLLWCLYELSNTRNWLLVKSSINRLRLVILSIFRFLRLCSFPPTIQFFSEVYLLGECSGVLLYILFWCFYLFFGGLVPLVLCGHLLIRREYYECTSYSYYCYFIFILVLCFWCYFGILVL